MSEIIEKASNRKNPNTNPNPKPNPNPPNILFLRKSVMIVRHRNHFVQIKSNQFYLDTAYLTNDSGVFTIKKIIIMIKKKNIRNKLQSFTSLDKV